MFVLASDRSLTRSKEKKTIMLMDEDKRSVPELGRRDQHTLMLSRSHARAVPYESLLDLRPSELDAVFHFLRW